MRSVWPWLTVALAACSFKPSGGGDDVDPDAAVDPDGRLVDAGPGDPDAPSGPDAPVGPDAPACEPSCQGDVLVPCGTGPLSCAAGCALNGGAHCAVFQPSNGVSPAAAQTAAVDLTVPAGRYYVFDTDTGAITDYDSGGTNGIVVRGAGTGVVDQIDFATVTQTGTPVGLGAWSFRSVTVADGTAEIELRGSRAGAIVAGGPIVIHGLVDVSGGQDSAGNTCDQCGGAGGGTGGTIAAAATGCAPGGAGNYSGTAWETGGAGGGMATRGGAGGSSVIAGGVSAQVTACSPAELIPLVGGGGGGRGATNSGSGGSAGGGGGGGLQLTSLTSLVVDGAGAEIYAGGMGGTGDGTQYGGGGGGAGGALLLEAPTVTLGTNAIITANGGGGGAGRVANDGQFGQSSAVRAAGGIGDGPGNNNGRGGFGGVVSSGTDMNLLPTAGRGGDDGTGGGGGAAGRVRLNTRVGQAPATNGALVSPAATAGTRDAQ